MPDLDVMRRGLHLFITERLSDNTDPHAPNPGLSIAGGPARTDAGNDRVGR